MQESDGQIYPHHPSPNLILAYKLTALLQHYVCLKDLVVLAVQILALEVPLIWNDQLLPHREHACSSSQAQLEGPFCGEHPREKLRLPRLFAAELGPRLPEESLWLSSQGQEGRWRRRALDSGSL